MNENVTQKRKAALHKYGYHSFIILASLVLLDGSVRLSGFDWIEPFTGSFIIVMTAFLYIQVRLIFSGIYYEKLSMSMSVIANIIISVVAILMIISIVTNFQTIPFISSGRLTDSCFQIFFAFYLVVTSIAAWIKIILDKSKTIKL